MTVRHDAHRDRLVLTRTSIAPDTRSERQKALQDALDAASIFSDPPKVTVETIDENGIETGYRITFDKSMNTGSPGFQMKVEEALASLAGGSTSQAAIGPLIGIRAEDSS